jgi:hypothetical protein
VVVAAGGGERWQKWWRQPVIEVLGFELLGWGGGGFAWS